MMLTARVMAGGDALCTERQGVVEEGAELDFLVAQHIRIGCAPGAVFGQKMFEDTIPILAGEIHRMQGDAEPRADSLCVTQVFRSRTVAVGIVLIPVLHEQALHMLALFVQE